MLAAIRRASSRESRCAAERLPGFPKDSVVGRLLASNEHSDPVMSGDAGFAKGKCGSVQPTRSIARDFDEATGSPPLWNAVELTKLRLSSASNIGRWWLRDEFALPPVRQWSAP
jgi:hypothetical protein